MDITKLSAENIDKLTPEQRAEIIKFYLEKRAAAAAEKQQQTPQIATESPFSFSPQPQVLPEPPKPVQEPKMRNPFFLDSESGFNWTANPETTGHLIRF